MNILITDTETNGVNPATDKAIEVGAILFNLDHMAPVVSYSALIRCDGQPAETERINGIPSDLLKLAPEAANVWDRVRPMVCASHAVLAHSADFDRGFVPEDLRDARPWVCTMDDITWPMGGDSKSLVSTVLAHGLGVSSAHRALTDCDMIARLLMRCHELGHDVRAMIERGMRPKGRYRAEVNYGSNDLARAAGFRFLDVPTKGWYRSMAVEDAEKITVFRVTRLDRPKPAEPLFAGRGAT